MGEIRRETEKEREIERERRGSETDVPKLYPTMNMNSLCYGTFQTFWISNVIYFLGSEMLYNSVCPYRIMSVSLYVRVFKLID